MTKGSSSSPNVPDDRRLAIDCLLDSTRRSFDAALRKPNCRQKSCTTSAANLLTSISVTLLLRVIPSSSAAKLLSSCAACASAAPAAFMPASTARSAAASATSSKSAWSRSSRLCRRRQERCSRAAAASCTISSSKSSELCRSVCQLRRCSSRDMARWITRAAISLATGLMLPRLGRRGRGRGAAAPPSPSWSATGSSCASSASSSSGSSRSLPKSSLSVWSRPAPSLPPKPPKPLWFDMDTVPQSSSEPRSRDSSSPSSSTE
mmetsp:Transcript_23918/g.75349  ORF Transcript_23918/g.75349 Transcript_23918/m.75349 type:complete len:263 (-) Transcript_23918:295-1083(-)